MDPEFKGVLFTLLIDTCIAAACYAVFYHRKRGEAVAFRQLHEVDQDDEEVALRLPVGGGDSSDVHASTPVTSMGPVFETGGGGEESKTDAEGGEKKALNLRIDVDVGESLHGGGSEDSPEAAEVQLEDSHGDVSTYLLFHTVAFKVFAVFSAIGLVVLVPLYVEEGDGEVRSTVLEHTSAGTMAVGSGLLILPFLFTVAFCITVYWFVSRFLRKIRRENEIHPEKILRAPMENRAIHISGLGTSFLSKSALRQMFENRFPDQVDFVYVVKDYSQLQELVQRRTEVINGIERCDIILERDGREVQQVDCCNGAAACMGSSRDQLQTELALLNADIEREVRASHTGTGHAFVVFKELPPSLIELRAAFGMEQGVGVSVGDRSAPYSNVHPGSGSDRIGTNWEFEHAAASDDIMWENLHMSRVERYMRLFAGNAGLMLLMVTLIAPLAVLEKMSPLLDHVQSKVSEEEDNLFRVIIGNYVPSFVVFIINSVLLPYLIQIVAEFECHTHRSNLNASVLHKNALFLFLNTVLLPSLSLTSVTAFIELGFSTSLSNWNDIVGRVLLSSSGAFFVQYLIHASFLGFASQLLDMPQRVSRKWKRYNAVTDRERHAAEEEWEFDFAYNYSERVTVFGVVLLYSAIVPLVLPVGALFFALSWWVDKHNLSNSVYKIQASSNGRLAAAVSRYLLVYVALTEFAIGSFFMVQGTPGWYAMGVLLWVATIGTLIMYCTHVFKFKPRSIVEEEDAAIQEAQGRHIVNTASVAVVEAESRVEAEEYAMFSRYVHPLQRPHPIDDLIVLSTLGGNSTGSPASPYSGFRPAQSPLSESHRQRIYGSMQLFSTS